MTTTPVPFDGHRRASGRGSRRAWCVLIAVYGALAGFALVRARDLRRLAAATPRQPEPPSPVTAAGSAAD